MAELDIRGPFGSSVPATLTVPEPGLPEQQDSGLDKRVLVTDAEYESELAKQARSAREARLNQLDASPLVAMGASIMEWDSARLLRRIARPHFDDDHADGFDINDALNHTPLALTEDELEYVTSVGQGPKSFQYAVQEVEAQRERRRLMGDYQGVAIGTAFFDPLWLLIPASPRIARAGAVGTLGGRVAAAALAGGIQGAAIAAGEGPVSDVEIAQGMLWASAAGAAFYGSKGLQKAPNPLEQPAIDALRGTGTARRVVSPAVFEDVQVQMIPAATRVPDEVLAHLPETGPGFWSNKQRYSVQFDDPLDHAMYLVSEGKANPTVQRWLYEQSGLGVEDIERRVKDIKSTLKNSAKGKQTTVRVPKEEGHMFQRPVTRTERRLVKEAEYEELPPVLAPGAVPTDARTLVNAVEEQINKEAERRGLGRNFQWNTHKTMSSFGPVGKKIADLIYDDVGDFSKNAMESHREAIMDRLRAPQFEYEDMLRKAMAEDGYGTLRSANPATAADARAVQLRIEREVQRELQRREMRLPPNTDITPRVAQMADKLDELHALAVKEMKAAGVQGAENLMPRSGHLSRRWNSVKIEDTIQRYMRAGLSRKEGKAKVADLVSMALQRGSGMTKEMADQVGTAVIDRALRMGVFDDGGLSDFRDALARTGKSSFTMSELTDLMREGMDEAGKAGFLKHRLDLDYNAQAFIGNEAVSVNDLIDSNVSTIVNQYVQRVSTEAAFARKGLRSASDISAMRTELAESIADPRKRQRAVKQLDDSIAWYKGDPSGAHMNDTMRLMQAYGRAISLSWAGLWQTTEYATMMGEYGLRNTLKYAIQEIPGFKGMIKPDRATANSLNNILANYSSMSIRMRPFLDKFEDGFDMDIGSKMQLAAQQWNHAVPYANGMKFVHHHQAQIMGNLILDRLDLAAKGNIKAREALAKYGLEAAVMDRLATEIKAKGFMVDQWDDALWLEVHPALTKMMDTAVMRGRLGDVPAFAAFDPVGKFIFTYRSFVLTAHNKLLAGGLERNGPGAVGLMLMYQLPLAMAAVQAKSVATGEGVLSTDELVKKSVGQMGGLGLLTEPFKWATGESNAWGASGLIPVDRGIRLFQGAVNADKGKAAAAAAAMVPVASASPAFRIMESMIKKGSE